MWETDYIETVGPVKRIGVMRDPADCCQEKTTSGGCDHRFDYSEESAIEYAREVLSTTDYPVAVDAYAYGWILGFETATLGSD